MKATRTGLYDTRRGGEGGCQDRRQRYACTSDAPLCGACIRADVAEGGPREAPRDACCIMRRRVVRTPLGNQSFMESE